VTQRNGGLLRAYILSVGGSGSLLSVRRSRLEATIVKVTASKNNAACEQQTQARKK